MPDGDITHPTLNRPFLRVYGQMCEGHWEPSTLGYRLLHPLKGRIKSYGNVPIELGNELMPILRDAFTLIRNGGQIIFSKYSNQIMDLSKNRAWNSSPRGRDIMVEASKKSLVEIQHGKVANDEIDLILFKNYVNTIFKKDFEDRVQETPVHYKDADPIEINNILDDMRPHINRGCDEFVKQLIKFGDVGKLRRPNRLKEACLDIDDEAW